MYNPYLEKDIFVDFKSTFVLWFRFFINRIQASTHTHLLGTKSSIVCATNDVEVP